LDPSYPDWIHPIRIGLGINWVSGKEEKKFEKLDVLSGGLEASPVASKSYLEVKAVL
jgi:hypothetical protein